MAFTLEDLDAPIASVRGIDGDGGTEKFIGRDAEPGPVGKILVQSVAGGAGTLDDELGLEQCRGLPQQLAHRPENPLIGGQRGKGRRHVAYRVDALPYHAAAHGATLLVSFGCGAREARRKPVAFATPGGDFLR